MSNVMKKLWVELSLTKQQMDKLNRFLKAVIICLTPENENCAEHIHAGYLSCTRESAQRVAENETNLEQTFLSCDNFALAFDTALFDREHVLSCIILSRSTTKLNNGLCFWRHAHRQQVKISPLSSTTSYADCTFHSTNWVVSHRMELRIWLEWLTAW